MYISANTITSTITKIEVQLHKSDIDANWVNQAPVSAFCEQKKVQLQSQVQVHR